ncbi:MAG: GTPase [Flavobacteriaceae bacterium]|nr:GTPase [Flavobacteriaceae bacterium]
MKYIFVYNANSGTLSLWKDILHKIVSPSTYPCSLCAMTHDTFEAKAAWKKFLSTFKYPIEFLHKDQWKQSDYFDEEIGLPVVLSSTDKTTKPKILFSTEDLTQMNLEDFTTALEEHAKKLQQVR